MDAKNKSELPKEFRGKYVTRAAFTKIQMERDRLMKDIHGLVINHDLDLFIKWRKHFSKKAMFNQFLKEMFRLHKTEIEKL